MTVVYRSRVGHWTVVVRELPFNLGHIFRLEDGDGFHVGPANLRLLGPLAWWWTRDGAEDAIWRGRAEAIFEGF